jgi:hypothetical protein
MQEVIEGMVLGMRSCNAWFLFKGYSKNYYGKLINKPESKKPLD